MKDRSLFILLATLINCGSLFAVDLDSILTTLDRTISESNIYTSKKQERIEQLNSQRRGLDPLSERYHQLNRSLYREYRAFVCDSAIAILNNTIEQAERNGNKDWVNESKLDLVYQLASASMYKEASDMLSTIDRSNLAKEQLVRYYSCYERIYGEISFYTQDKVNSGAYWSISNCYKDSILILADRESDEGLNWLETKLRDDKDFEKALGINDQRVKSIDISDPRYALVAYCRSQIYKDLGDINHQKYYLAISAISDIESATRDHASLWMLAEILNDEGDFERAYRYITFSWSETKLYNARLRSWQSADVLSLIDQTYQSMIESQNSKLGIYNILTTLLLILLVAALIYIYRQMRKLSLTHQNLELSNDKLYHLNEELKYMNKSLHSVNLELSESNHVKEEYIARFIKLSSTYLDKLEGYRRMVHKSIVAGKSKELLKSVSSQESFDSEQAELLANFDEAFLQIFPNFVQEFNKLLSSQEQIVLKRAELLNTELRIFALIRLGIEDSSQIAEFLRYSVNTIYNYRSKVKNKAVVERDDFELYVKRIR
ncbi:MAG: DUF6377 domain-containing protein [Bacteroidales bacterium]